MGLYCGWLGALEMGQLRLRPLPGRRLALLLGLSLMLGPQLQQQLELKLRLAPRLALGMLGLRLRRAANVGWALRMASGWCSVWWACRYFYG